MYTHTTIGTVTVSALQWGSRHSVNHVMIGNGRASCGGGERGGERCVFDQQFYLNNQRMCFILSFSK
jgi:hypothetical protein